MKKRERKREREIEKERDREFWILYKGYSLSIVKREG